MKGTMSEQGAGVWRLRVLTGYTTDGRAVQRSKTVKGTRREAQTELAKFVAEAEAKNVAASGAVTFGRYLTEQYLPQVKDNLSPETYRNHGVQMGHGASLGGSFGDLATSRATRADLAFLGADRRAGTPGEGERPRPVGGDHARRPDGLPPGRAVRAQMERPWLCGWATFRRSPR
jgi:hypothetical protein